MPSRSPILDGRGDTPAVNAGLPRRHQRSRRKGARTPAGVIYCGRPTIRANPFNWKRVGGHARSVGLYKCWLERRLGALTLGRLGYCPKEIDALFRMRHRLEAEMPRLVGADLQCWCPLTSRWCHVDVLIAHVARLAIHSKPARHSHARLAAALGDRPSPQGGGIPSPSTGTRLAVSAPVVPAAALLSCPFPQGGGLCPGAQEGQP